MARWRLVRPEEEILRCEEPMGKKAAARLKCEKPLGHVDADQHAARDAAGRWHIWQGERRGSTAAHR